MKFDWLKGIIGDGYTPELDEKVAQELPKHFVVKADFDAKNDTAKTAEATIAALRKDISDRDKQIEELGKLDAAGLQEQIETLTAANAADAKARKEAEDAFNAELARRDFEAIIDRAVAESKAKDATSVKAHLDLKALQESKNQSKDIADALSVVKKEKDFLFDSGEPIDKPIVGSTGKPSGPAGMSTLAAAMGLTPKDLGE